jgi:hypothetical protein
LFPSIIWRMPVSTGPIFSWLIGGDWRKVPFDWLSAPLLIQDVHSLYVVANVFENSKFYKISPK